MFTHWTRRGVVAVVVGSVLVVGGCSRGSAGEGPTNPATGAPTTLAPVETSSAPTPTPTPTPSLLAARAGLPPLYALPADVWDRTGPGWVLGVYRSTRTDAVAADGQATPVVDALVLASPDGTTYFVRDLTGEVDVAHWKGGSTTALTTDGRTLDLRTGAVSGTAVPNLMSSSVSTGQFVGMDTTGQPLWFAYPGELLAGVPAHAVTEGLYPLLSPDGRHVVLSPVDDGFSPGFLFVDTATSVTSTVAFAVPGQVCGQIAWSSASSFTALCVRSDFTGWGDSPDGGDPKLYTVDAATGAASLLGPLDVKGVVPLSSTGALLPDGATASVGTSSWLDGDSCPSGVYRWAGAKGTPLVDESTGYGNMFTLQVAGGRTWVGQTGGCSGDATPHVLWSIGTDGALRLVFPYPEGKPGTDQPYYQGLTSWAPAS